MCPHHLCQMGLMYQKYPTMWASLPTSATYLLMCEIPTVWTCRESCHILTSVKTLHFLSTSPQLSMYHFACATITCCCACQNLCRLVAACLCLLRGFSCLTQGSATAWTAQIWLSCKAALLSSFHWTLQNSRSSLGQLFVCMMFVKTIFYSFITPTMSPQI